MRMHRGARLRDEPRGHGRKPPRVADFMSRDVLTCEPDTDLARAGWLMWEGDCGALPVVIEGEVVGMITDRDLALAAALKPRPCVDIRVSEAMSAGDVALVRSDASVAQALALMGRRRVRRLPVVDADGRLVGILSLGDLLRNGGTVSGELLNVLSAVSEPRMRATV